ncbi:nucleotidyltransferase family protein [Rubellimicrobium sp. CFH 75288]|uniref:nucleotidyltransferase family protein n=1 Tax=Rubellimicrobium sp. CFH 75288 TaxID=2697034 RepID=UPI0014128061|nr:nucleotidyltransferase family protein [Rubellimicrobium sp. CFH 75288]NAZ37788.1 NTP transferase domain-containing protein [Rubellimicrobium sp. CFH 75288]
MIFAAGLGTRMGALTANRPKPLLTVAGRTLLDRALAVAEAAGADPVVVNVHHHADQIRAHLEGRAVRIADETATLLETGGGLRAARPLLGPGPVWTLNSDAVWTGPNPLRRLAAAWRPGMEALLLLVPLSRARAHRGSGDFAIGADGRLVRGGGFVYTGAQIVRPEGLDRIPEAAFSLNRLWDAALGRGGVFGLVHAGEWCDVGRPEGLEAAETLLRREGDPADVA